MPWLGTSVGRLRLSILPILLSYGLMPPCMQNIFYSTTAAKGIALNTSQKRFQAAKDNLRLPTYPHTYINRRSRRVCWLLQTRGYLLGGRSFQGTWFCSRVATWLFTVTACLGLRSLPETDSFSQAENHWSRIFLWDLRTVRGCPLRSWWVLIVRAGRAGLGI